MWPEDKERVNDRVWFRQMEIELGGLLLCHQTLQHGGY